LSKITRQSSEFHEEIHQLERVHAVDKEIANIQPQELLDNDHYLRDAIGDLGQDLIDHETDVSNPHNVTHAQTGPEAADPTKTTTSRHKHVSDADLKQVYDTKSDLAAHENDNENPHLVTHAQTGPEGATLGTNTAKDKHVSNADYKRWEDHLANKSNPHAVTAAQVGAAPNPHGNNHHTEAFMPQAGGTFSGNVTIGRNATLRKVIQSSGSTVTIVDLEGRVHFAVYNDLAEFLPSVERVEPGDVVVWDEGGVRACDRNSHTGVVGVVSDTFGPILGGNPSWSVEETMKSGEFAPVALAGRVWVKAVGPIERFDLLESSETKGHARRSSEGKPGVVIGKALESLPEGETKRICMLVMLG
jgi:hypothetical protein